MAPKAKVKAKAKAKAVAHPKVKAKAKAKARVRHPMRGRRLAPGRGGALRRPAGLAGAPLSLEDRWRAGEVLRASEVPVELLVKGKVS